MQSTYPFSSEFALIESATVARALDSDGIYCASSVISDASLSDLRAAVFEQLSNRGHRSFSLVEPAKDVLAFSAILSNPLFAKLMKDLAIGALDSPSVRKSSIYNVLRVIAGEHSNEEMALLFHFDATVVTALVPIVIPDGTPEEAGDFIFVPGFRPLHENTFWNVVEKVFFQNHITRKVFAARAKRREPRMRILRLVPGNMYFFYGYRTYHANFGVAAGSTRATLLFHFGDPHLKSPITRLILAVRQWRVRRHLRQLHSAS